MIRLKQTMGNTIKCKVDAEYMVSKYECNVLNTNRLNGIFECKIEKESGITYVGEVRKNLYDKTETGINEKSLLSYIQQTVNVIRELQKLNLNPEKLILHPDWIFFEKDESTLKFLYCPVNGAALKYDAVLFMRDLVFQANLSAELREKWNRWLQETSKTGITEKRVSELSKFETSSGNNRVTFSSKKDDWDDEPRTGLENECDWFEEGDDEPMTGVEDSYDYMQDDDNEAKTGMENPYDLMLDDEDEALTGIEDDCIFSGSNMDDGTHMESTIKTYGETKTPQLERISTGEKKKITKSEFKIGRSTQRADFCISGNSGVSNVHATVICIGNRYYLKDNHSTNGTYVDGVKITDSGEQIPLRDGSVIRVYNEDIIFSL